MNALFRLQHSPGFRLNLWDVLLVGGCFVMTVWLREIAPDFPLWWLPAYGATSFFMFCNVLRLSFRFELPWLATCLVSAGMCITQGWDAALWVPLASEPFRFFMVWWAARIGWYRGICWHALAHHYGHDPELIRIGKRPPFRLPW
jgi:hypothetical protein